MIVKGNVVLWCYLGGEELEQAGPHEDLGHGTGLDGGIVGSHSTDLRNRNDDVTGE